MKEQENEVKIEGRLLKKVEAKVDSNNHTWATFTIIHTRSYRDRKTGERSTDFFDVIVWDKLAKLLDKMCDKGDLIMVIGHLQKRKYTTSEGITNKRIEIVADDIVYNGISFAEVDEEKLKVR